MTRQTEPGPKPGSYVITLELPHCDPNSKDDMECLAQLQTAIRAIGSKLFTETWITTHRVMGNRGKHGSVD